MAQGRNRPRSNPIWAGQSPWSSIPFFLTCKTLKKWLQKIEVSNFQLDRALKYVEVQNNLQQIHHKYRHYHFILIPGGVMVIHRHLTPLDPRQTKRLLAILRDLCENIARNLTSLAASETNIPNLEVYEFLREAINFLVLQTGGQLDPSGPRKVRGKVKRLPGSYSAQSLNSVFDGIAGNVQGLKTVLSNIVLEKMECALEHVKDSWNDFFLQPVKAPSFPLKPLSFQLLRKVRQDGGFRFKLAKRPDAKAVFQQIQDLIQGLRQHMNNLDYENQPGNIVALCCSIIEDLDILTEAFGVMNVHTIRPRTADNYEADHSDQDSGVEQPSS